MTGAPKKSAARAGDQIRHFDFWCGRHDKKHYTPAYNTFLLGIMSDRTLRLETRALASAIVYAWGNFSDP